MRLQGIRNLGSLLGLLVTATVIWYRNSPGALVAGIAFLMAADILCLMCVIQAVKLRTRKGTALESGSSFIYGRGAYVLLLVAWQIAIVGVLNISSEIASISALHLLTDYASAVLYYFVSFQILSLADSAKQNGGYKPVNFFGYPRSRKLIFAIFAGYCTICPLTIISLEDSLARAGWRPVALQSSQACLLMVAIMSLMSAGLIYQRYRGIVTKDKRRGAKILGVALLFLICAAITQQRYGIYVYILSAIATIGCAVSSFCLWQIDENASGDVNTIELHPSI